VCAVCVCACLCVCVCVCVCVCLWTEKTIPVDCVMVQLEALSLPIGSPPAQHRLHYMPTTFVRSDDKKQKDYVQVHIYRVFVCGLLLPRQKHSFFILLRDFSHNLPITCLFHFSPIFFFIRPYFLVAISSPTSVPLTTQILYNVHTNHTGYGLSVARDMRDIRRQP